MCSDTRISDIGTEGGTFTLATGPVRGRRQWSHKKRGILSILQI